MAGRRATRVGRERGPRSPAVSVLRVGVVGTGAIARLVHLPSLASLRDVRLVALADPSPEARAAAAALVPGAVPYRGLEEMLAAGGIDAVVVLSPSGAHARHAETVLRAGLHLYVEKPLAAAVDDARTVARLAREADVVALTGFNRRLHPLVDRLRHLLATHAVGAVVRVEGAFFEPRPPETMPAWKRERASGGGAGLDLVSHHVDLVRHLLGAEVEQARGTFRSERSEHDDVGLALVLDGGVEVRLAGSFVRPRRDVLAVHGTGGTLVLDRFAGTLRGPGAGSLPTPGELALRARCRLRPGHDPSYRAALAAFAAAAAGTPDDRLASIEDGLRVVEALHRAGG